MTQVNFDLRAVAATGRVPVDGRIRWQPVERRTDGAVVILPEVHGVGLVGGVAVAELDPGYYLFTEATVAGGSAVRLVPAVGPVDYAALVAVDPATLAPSAVPDPAWVAMAEATVSGGSIIGDDLVLERTDGGTVNAGNVRGPVGPMPVDYVKTSADTVVPSTPAGEYGVNIVDAPDNLGIASHIDHYGAGAGFDIRNRPGAGMAIVLHQYGNGTGVRLDNTGTGPMLVIAQTHNEILNPESLPDSSALGDAFRQVDWQGNYWARLDARGAIVLTPPADQLSETLRIIGNATAAKSSVRVTHNGPSHGVNIEAGAGAAGFYPLLVSGQNYGAAVSTATNGGQAVVINKNGTGAGEALRLVNKGTGPSLQVNQNATPVSRVNADGELEQLVNGKGLLLRSPNGTRYRVSVSDGGALSVVAAP